MTNLNSVLKSRDITLPAKVCIVKAMVFPVVMYGCGNWTTKKAEQWRIDAFNSFNEKIPEIPLDCKRSNQSVLKEISSEYSSEGLMLKLKLQYFGHLMWRADSLEKTLMPGKIEGRRRRGWQRMKCLDSTANAMDMNLGKLQEIVRDAEACHVLYLGWIDTYTIIYIDQILLTCAFKMNFIACKLYLNKADFLNCIY